MMTNNTHQVADFDTIIGDEVSRILLSDSDLMPATWGIQDAEKHRIQDAGLYLVVVPELKGTRWPASIRGMTAEIDVNAIRSGFLTREHWVALILHEFGHRLNPPLKQAEPPYSIDVVHRVLERQSEDQTQKAASKDECNADDYVRHCGFEGALYSGLITLQRSVPSFQTQSTIDRIKRIEENEPLTLVFQS